MFRVKDGRTGNIEDSAIIPFLL